MRGWSIRMLATTQLLLFASLTIDLGTLCQAADSCPTATHNCMASDAAGRIKPSGEDYFGTAGDELVDEMKAENIERNLKYLTSKGHMAGTRQDLEQAEYLRKLWLDQGLDQAFLQPYNVQLSYPDLSRPNKVYLMDEEGQVKFTSSVMEEPLDGVQYDESIPPAFLAFSPAGTIITDELVYVNYGRYEDFEAVEAAGVSVAGRLVMAKFGRVFRGDKVLNAQRFKASGIILYTDPKDYHPESESGGLAFPHSFWLPNSGIQRGSIVWRDGDPTTPNYPSIDGSYRLPEEQTDTPSIPAQTLSCNDARKLLVNLGGQEVPASWRGGLNITYRMGPNLVRHGWKVKLEVNNVKRTLPVYNVIGLIRGSEEPDRYVIYGNHRDSWTFGSIDPSSATAVQMEVVRAYGRLVTKGWRPRRSIVFASWAASEFGFFGVWECVEEYLKVFNMRAVANLNVDLAIIQNYNLVISATPLLHKIIKEATKRTPAPDPSLGYETLWDHWSQRLRAASPDYIDYNLGSISDHAPFYQGIGVPSSYMVWEINFDEYDWSDYPLYHSTFENFDAVKNILDPEFQYHLSLGQLWALMGIGLADAKILPMDPEDETVMLRRMLVDLKRDFGQTLTENGISLEHLETVIERFAHVARLFNAYVGNLDDVSPLLARQLNDQLLLLERCFIHSEGSPTRPYMKNMVFGTSDFNQYEGSLAPGVRDAIWDATQCRESCPQRWGVVQEQLSVLQYVINSALLAMKDIRQL